MAPVLIPFIFGGVGDERAGALLLFLEYTRAKITSVPRKLRWSLLLKESMSKVCGFFFRLFVVFCFVLVHPCPPQKE